MECSNPILTESLCRDTVATLLHAGLEYGQRTSKNHLIPWGIGREGAEGREAQEDWEITTHTSYTICSAHTTL